MNRSLLSTLMFASILGSGGGVSSSILKLENEGECPCAACAIEKAMQDKSMSVEKHELLSYTYDHLSELMKLTENIGRINVPAIEKIRECGRLLEYPGIVDMCDKLIQFQEGMSAAIKGHNEFCERKEAELKAAKTPDVPAAPYNGEQI